MNTFALLTIVGFIVAGGYYAVQAAQSQQQEGGVDVGTEPIYVPTDYGTVVDLNQKTWEFCRAIALAEGFQTERPGEPLHVPTRFHNPGDLGPGDTGYPGEDHDGSVVSKLPDDKTGWGMLYHKISNIFAGNSMVYNTSMTIAEMGSRYATPSNNYWAQNVANALGVTPNTVIADWLQMQ